MSPEQQPNHAIPERTPSGEDDVVTAAERKSEALKLFLETLWQDASASAEQPDSESRLAFETTYVGSYEKTDDFAYSIMIELGWHRLLQTAARVGNIPLDALGIDYDIAFDYLSRYFHFIRTDAGLLHVFSRPGVAPPSVFPVTNGGSR